MGPTWGPPGSCRSQMGPMLAPWNFEIREYISVSHVWTYCYIKQMSWIRKQPSDAKITLPLEKSIAHCTTLRQSGTLFKLVLWAHNLNFVKNTVLPLRENRHSGQVRTLHLCCYMSICQLTHLTNPTMHHTNIPQCTIWNRNVNTCAHFCYKMLHCGKWHRCILGFCSEMGLLTGLIS